MAHILAPAPYGGLESVVVTLARSQVASGMEVTIVGVFARAPQRQPFWEEVSRISGLSVVPLVISGRRYMEERAGLRAILAEARAGLVHTHGYRPDVLAPGLAREAGLPVVSTVHGFSGGGLKNRIYEWLQRRSLRRFDAVVAVSGKLERELVADGVPAERVHCVPNTWSPSSAPLARAVARDHLDLPPDAPVVGWVGRMTPVKGPDVMLDAFRGLPDEIHLGMIGDGPMTGDLLARSEREGMGPRIHWHGPVPGAAQCLLAFDVLAITSWSEGTPMVLLEAMAAGVPIVATAVGGIPDVVSENEALLVEAGDVQGIARAVRTSLEDRDGSRMRSEAARERLTREFATDRWVERYQRIYESCNRSRR